MTFLSRYNTAVHATSLKPGNETTHVEAVITPIDIIGAAGLAARHEPLGIAVARMLAGGGKAEAINQLSSMAYERSFKINRRVTPETAQRLAQMVMTWYMHGTCQPCGGRGYSKIEGAPALGDQCKHCWGSGKISFDEQFTQETVDLARWLSGQIEKSQARAGYVAAHKLVERA